MIIPPIHCLQEYSGSMDVQGYINIGRLYAEKFDPYIKEGDRVLEVGCGCGRIAQALSKKGLCYEGFDVVKEAIDFCKELEIPNFNFKWVNLYNSHYNKAGIPADEFVFPYEDNSFDFIFLTSVFTHVGSEVVSHYVKEINRVLKPGKYCCATFFLLNNGKRDFTEWAWTPYKDYYVVHMDNPDAITGYEESLIRQMINIDFIQYANVVEQQDTVWWKK